MIDCVYHTEIGESEIPVQLHGNHYVAEDTLASYVRTLIETPCSNVYVVDSGTTPDVVRSKPNNCKLIWMRHVDRIMFPCPGLKNDEQCPVFVSLCRVQNQEIHDVLNSILPRVRRHLHKEETSGIDCPRCIDPEWDQGFGFILSEDMRRFPEYDNNSVECYTCGHIWCKGCGVDYPTHSGKSCWRVAEEQKYDGFSSDELIRTITVKCPSCQINIDKNGGCNHMTCRCGAEFCFSCMKIMGSGHFATTKCNQFGYPDDWNRNKDKYNPLLERDQELKKIRRRRPDRRTETIRRPERAHSTVRRRTLAPDPSWPFVEPRSDPTNITEAVNRSRNRSNCVQQ